MKCLTIRELKRYGVLYTSKGEIRKSEKLDKNSQYYFLPSNVFRFFTLRFLYQILQMIFFFVLDPRTLPSDLAVSHGNNVLPIVSIDEYQSINK